MQKLIISWIQIYIHVACIYDCLLSKNTLRELCVFNERSEWAVRQNIIRNRFLRIHISVHPEMRDFT